MAPYAFVFTLIVGAQAQTHQRLHLNDGEKWKADSPSRQAFEKMEKIEEAFEKKVKSPTLKDYNQLGADLQAELDILFKECRMQGESHNQLHHLLELVIADVKALKSNDIKSATEAYHSLDEHLDLFEKYFE